MTPGWSVRLPIAEGGTLARLRGRHGLEVCLLNDAIWLCGRDMDDDLDRKLRTLPGTRFAVLADRQLIPAGCRVPKGYLPDGSWTALSDAVSVELEPPAFAGRSSGRVGLRLVRGGPVREANLLLTTVQAWVEYVDRAPQVRLEQLVFAVNGDGDVLIRGTPLPPLQGQRFVEDNGIAAAAGWIWSPPVDSEVLRDSLRLEPHDLALLHEDGTWDHVRGADFVRATRSAARLSQEGAGHE